MFETKLVDLVRTRYGIYELPCWKASEGDVIESKNGTMLKVLSVVAVVADSECYKFIKGLNGGKFSKPVSVYNRRELNVQE